MVERKPIAEQVSWNLSESIIQQIGELLHQSRTAYLNGELDKCFYAVREIIFLIYADLNEDERNKIEDMRKRFLEYHKLSRVPNIKIKKILEKQYGEVPDFVDLKAKADEELAELRKYLMILLDANGYTIQKKQETQRMF